MTATATPPTRFPAVETSRRMAGPPPNDFFETVACYLCGDTAFTNFLTAEDDLTGKP